MTMESQEGPFVPLAAFKEILDNLTRRIQTLEVREAGSGIGPWMAWTPLSVVQGGTTLTYATAGCKFQRIGHIVVLIGTIQFTSAGTAGGAVTIALSGSDAPLNQNYQAAVGYNAFGSGLYYDPGTAWYGCFPFWPSSFQLQFWVSDRAIANLLGIDPSFAVANGDTLNFCSIYEAAP